MTIIEKIDSKIKQIESDLKSIGHLYKEIPIITIPRPPHPLNLKELKEYAYKCGVPKGISADIRYDDQPPTEMKAHSLSYATNYTKSRHPKNKQEAQKLQAEAMAKIQMKTVKAGFRAIADYKFAKKEFEAGKILTAFELYAVAADEDKEFYLSLSKIKAEKGGKTRQGRRKADPAKVKAFYKSKSREYADPLKAKTETMEKFNIKEKSLYNYLNT